MISEDSVFVQDQKREYVQRLVILSPFTSCLGVSQHQNLQTAQLPNRLAVEQTAGFPTLIRGAPPACQLTSASSKTLACNLGRVRLLPLPSTYENTCICICNMYLIVDSPLLESEPSLSRHYDDHVADTACPSDLSRDHHLTPRTRRGWARAHRDC